MRLVYITVYILEHCKWRNILASADCRTITALTAMNTLMALIINMNIFCSDPLYSIQLYPEFVDKLHEELGLDQPTPEHIADLMKQKLHDRSTFVVKRTMKMINAKLDDLLKQKGCDASSMFDEEIPASDQEFSDDEAEKEAKKIKKMKKHG